MTNEEMIKAIKSNYPPSNYTMLREALDKSILLLEEDKKELIYDIDKAIDYIIEKSGIKKEIIEFVLELEEEYMRTVGIIED